MGRGKKILKRSLGVGAALLGAVVIAGLVSGLVAHEPRPEARSGAQADPEAEALAARFEAAVDLAAWERTGAVEWGFAGLHEHLWDRRRGVVRVRWGDHEVFVFEGGPEGGRAFVDGREVHGDEAADLCESAYAKWINDAYWLNPIARLRDEGVSRSMVRLEDGTEGLMVAYASGGLTPGDAFVWIPGGPDGRPRAWRMWVSVMPVGGLEASWEGWRRLSTGAWISTEHALPLGLTLRLTDVRGAETLDALLGGPDPFAFLSAPE